MASENLSLRGSASSIRPAAPPLQERSAGFRAVWRHVDGEVVVAEQPVSHIHRPSACTQGRCLRRCCVRQGRSAARMKVLAAMASAAAKLVSSRNRAATNWTPTGTPLARTTGATTLGRRPLPTTERRCFSHPRSTVTESQTAYIRNSRLTRPQGEANPGYGFIPRTRLCSRIPQINAMDHSPAEIAATIERAAVPDHRRGNKIAGYTFVVEPIAPTVGTSGELSG